MRNNRFFMEMEFQIVMKLVWIQVFAQKCVLQEK